MQKNSRTIASNTRVMPLIELTTIINAPIERCFDLARSIDLHKLSTEGTHEEAIGGITSGLIGKNEEVTWRAKHFGISQTLSSRITKFDRPNLFRDEMIKGPFRSITHDHEFYESGGKTVMIDHFSFESPGWVFGMIINHFVLVRHLRSLLIKRNRMIKGVAESDDWKKLLNL